MRKIMSCIITLLVVLSFTTITAYANDDIYADEDIQTLMKIFNYKDNCDCLDWDFDEPESIYEVIWEEMDDNKLHITSITLSNLEISGTVDLKDCKYIDSVSFANSDIENVVLPDSIESLNSSSFSNCSSLVFVEFNSPDISIGRNTFSGCINLKTLLNTDCITTIGPNAFNNCSKVMFYGDTKSNYAYEYAKENRINFSTNKTVTAYCYVGIMMNKNNDTVDLTNGGIPYHTGYLENDYGVFYADSEGLIEFDIDLGNRQNVVIDGATAVTRNASFLIPYKNYEVNSKSNAIGVIVCDYIHDGTISDFETNYFNEFASTSSDWANKIYTSWK